MTVSGIWPVHSVSIALTVATQHYTITIHKELSALSIRQGIGLEPSNVTSSSEPYESGVYREQDNIPLLEKFSKFTHQLKCNKLRADDS